MWDIGSEYQHWIESWGILKKNNSGFDDLIHCNAKITTVSQNSLGKLKIIVLLGNAIWKCMQLHGNYIQRFNQIVLDVQFL